MRRRLWWAVVALLALGFGACMLEGAGTPDDPELARSRIPPFGEIAFAVVPAGAPATAERCALLAEAATERRRGLMGVTDLAGYTGMVFRFDEDTDGGFFMRNTPMPLSIAWFDGNGMFVSSADMEPCADMEGCPTYSPAGPYRVALEVPTGQLGELGIGPGAVLRLGGSCPVS